MSEQTINLILTTYYFTLCGDISTTR